MLHLMPIALAVSLMELTASSASAPSRKPGHSTRDVDVRGAKRQYNLYRPPMPDDRRPPLMVVMHGGFGNADSIERMVGMNDIADREKFLVAYPQGTAPPMEGMSERRTWNAGTCCGAAVRKNVDDVGFVAALIDDVDAVHGIDRRRVYAAGMSNGAMMVYRLASEIPERLAAVIVVAGSLGVDDCSKGKDVPILHIHGEHDGNVPFAGGRGEAGMSAVAHRSVPETIARVLAPRGTHTCDTKSGDGLERSIYQCSNGAPLELVVVRGGVHGWPGGRGRGEEARGSSSLSASEAAWAFAQRFEKESPPRS
jgi:polyhydroxybutyrate depolymerase